MAPYEVLRELGEGGFGQVVLARLKATKELVAVKKIAFKGHRSVLELSRIEIRVLRRLNHVHIVRFIDHELSPENAIIIMEYCAKGDLRGLIEDAISSRRTIAKEVIFDVAVQLCMGLHHCHHPSSMAGDVILHRDLKPENILFDAQGTLKLADFGLGKVLTPEQHHTRSFVGTPGYLSPELLHGRPYDVKTDIYSFGCVLFELIMLRCPRANAKGISRGIDLLMPSDVDDGLRMVCCRMLSMDPLSRPTTSDLLAESVIAGWLRNNTLSHPQEGDALWEREKELESKANALTKRAQRLDQEAARLKGIEIELKSREKRLQGREATVDAQYRKFVREFVPDCMRLLRPRLATRKPTSPKSLTSPKNVK
ncbi:kinase-like domain-containing protein [Papiliotrema laurentii]|uniref:non-specific serine/threonine protein kinase n=1 Tax=Papiliotrema laurentii TaxID=5418 RepID=A0AAD9CRW8_PAPLA|nr:kinase-like domain-containing protein [Papiliotrema laurentii]